MSLESVIKQRRTYHQFDGGVVDQEIINRCIELATWAPNHRLTYPWVFYDLGPKTRACLIDLAVELKQKSKGELSEAIKQSLCAKLASVSHMIMLGLKRVDDQVQQREDYATVACGIQNMSLYLSDKGFGSKWSTGEFTNDDATYDILQIDANKVELVGCLLVGTVNKNEAVKIPPRPSYKDVVHCRP